MESEANVQCMFFQCRVVKYLSCLPFFYSMSLNCVVDPVLQDNPCITTVVTCVIMNMG